MSIEVYFDETKGNTMSFDIKEIRDNTKSKSDTKVTAVYGDPVVSDISKEKLSDESDEKNIGEDSEEENDKKSNIEK